MLITCPQIDLAGNWNEDHSRCVRVRSDVTLVTIFCTFFYCSVSLDMPCNSNCSCELSKNTQSLVCDENGLTHFSPCYAGCDVDSKVNNSLPHPPTVFQLMFSLQVNNTLTGCACASGVMTLGACIEPCTTQFFIFSFTMLVMAFLSSLGRVPGTVLQLRYFRQSISAPTQSVTSRSCYANFRL